MRYLIDGYNFLFCFARFSGPFTRKRETLILRMHEQAQALDLELTLVFDSSDPLQDLEVRSHYRSIEVIYSCVKKSADETILDLVECSYTPQQFCVVTADRDLALKARNLKAEILSLEQFAQVLLKKRERLSRASEKEYIQSPWEIARLQKIFEKKLEQKD